jgi:serine/threonine protein kinase
VKYLFENWKRFLTEEDQGRFSIENRLSPEEIEGVGRWAGISGPFKHLGTGTMGAAYLAGDKVLKITRDISEAKAAATIMGVEHPNIYKVYAVGRISSNAWAIIMEYLPNSTPEMQFAAKDMYQTVRSGSGLTNKYFNWEGHGSLDPDEQKQISASISWAPPNLDKEAIKEHFHEIASALTFLFKSGVRFTDIKPSNVLSKNGAAAVIDLGRSYVKKDVEIPEIKF